MDETALDERVEASPGSFARRLIQEWRKCFVQRGEGRGAAGFTAEESHHLALLLKRFVDAWPRNPPPA